MDFLSKLNSSTQKPHNHNPDHHNAPNQNPEHHKPSPSELLSSAKLVADAAKSSFGSGPKSHTVDKGKLAGAAADLLGAASDYGKLDETKGIGKYVDKAEEYLNKYEKSHSGPHGSGAGPNPVKPHNKESAGSGFGDYMKMAEGFLKK